MSKLITQLETLTPEELQKVAKLINKFATRNEREESEESERPAKKQQKGPKKRPNKADSRRQDLKVEHGPGRSQPRKRIIVEADDEEEVVRPRRMGRGRSEPRNGSRRDVDDGMKGRRRKGVAARTESIQVSSNPKDNKFLKMKERNSAKNDTRIDKLLWGQNEPEARPDKFEFVEARCKGCKQYFDVNPALVFVGPRGQPSFTCNDCAQSSSSEIGYERHDDDYVGPEQDDDSGDNDDE